MNKDLRPIHCVSSNTGFPTLTVANYALLSKNEEEPNKILGMLITGYELDCDCLTVTVLRDRDGNYLGDGRVLTITFDSDTEEYKKMCSYIDKMFGIVPYEEWEQPTILRSLSEPREDKPCEICEQSRRTMVTSYYRNQVTGNTYCEACFEKIDAEDKIIEAKRQIIRAKNE